MTAKTGRGHEKKYVIKRSKTRRAIVYNFAKLGSDRC